MPKTAETTITNGTQSTIFIVSAIVSDDMIMTEWMSPTYMGRFVFRV